MSAATSRATSVRAPRSSASPRPLHASPSRASTPQPQRRVDRRSGQPRHRVGRLDRRARRSAASPSAAPPNTVPSAAQQPGVAAPVAGERGVGVGVPGGVQVADDVRAAERVDRLLRVADQHQRQCPGSARRMLPLHRVGVLELVDQHHPVPGPQPLAAAAADGVGQRVVQPGDQVVVGVQAARAACAAPPRRAPPSRTRGASAAAPVGAGAAPSRACGSPTARRASRRASARLERGGAGGRRGELADVEVVDDLDHQVVDGLDEAPRRRRRRPRCRGAVSICRQNWCVVAMVAASNSASAAVSRRRRTATSSSGTLASSAAPSRSRPAPGAGRAARARRSPAARAPARAAPGWPRGRR